MISIDEVQSILADLAAELPEEFFRELNGGILLLPETKMSPYAKANDLYILGEYQRGGSMGRLIKIYYGSFERLYGYMDKDKLTVELREVLRHEFTHHLESLAGERGLEIKDEQYMNKYLGKNK
ncbi:MAG: metallopeptidase family protein [Clostridiales bacterium]|nr:metallopeptidase family protein [Clostridiales bacterium]